MSEEGVNPSLECAFHLTVDIRLDSVRVSLAQKSLDEGAEVFVSVNYALTAILLGDHAGQIRVGLFKRAPRFLIPLFASLAVRMRVNPYLKLISAALNDLALWPLV